MDWLSRIVDNSPEAASVVAATAATKQQQTQKNDEAKEATQERANSSNDAASSRVQEQSIFKDVLESWLMYEHPPLHLFAILMFNIIFLTSLSLEITDTVVLLSAVAAAILSFWCLKLSINIIFSRPSQEKAEKVRDFNKKLRVLCAYIRKSRLHYAPLFYLFLGTISLNVSILGVAGESWEIFYIVCMAILLAPMILYWLPTDVILEEEEDNEVEDFLPAATEDNLQVLRRAGENEECSTTPLSSMSDSQEIFNYENLKGVRIPSYDEGSTDGMDLSEIELSSGETDVDGIKFQSGHFEKSSSSEEEAELEPESNKLLDHSSGSDSEFEIIDSSELNDIQDS